MNKSKYLNCLKEINKYNFNIYLLHEPIIFIVLSYLLPLNINSTVVVCLCLALSITISILISKFYYYLMSYSSNYLDDKFKNSKERKKVYNIKETRRILR